CSRARLNRSKPQYRHTSPRGEILSYDPHTGYASVSESLQFGIAKNMQNAGRVLIVEGEPLIAEMWREWLTELGCDVAGPAATNEAAFALLQDTSLTGAILDITVPDGVTYEVAKVLRERGVPF